MKFKTSSSSLCWPVVMYGCKSWTLKGTEENRINAFEMKSLTQVLRIPWMAQKTNDWVCETAGVEQSLLKSVKRRKLTYFGHVMRKEGECLEKDIIQGTIPDQGHPGSVTSHRGPEPQMRNGSTTSDSQRQRCLENARPQCDQPTLRGWLKTR